MVTLLLDVMGGDHAPAPNLEGALAFLPHLKGKLKLIGDEAAIRAALAKRRRFQPLLHAIQNTDQVEIVHAADTISMEDSIKTIRNKPGASINVGCKLASESWKAWKKNPEGPKPAGFISAGHSGAMMASALMTMGRLKQIERPAIAVTLPTLGPNGCVILDVGANVDCKPEHLRDFAVMGSLYATATIKGKLPRLGVLSNGEERSKGNELTRATCSLIEQQSEFQAGPEQIAEFQGYCEGKEIFKGKIDVVVTDGFVGNLVLKSVEGLGLAVVTLLKRQAKTNPFNLVGFALAAQAFRSLKKKLDYAEYGAAPLLGVAGYAFICHGRSDGRAIKNALLASQNALESHFLERLERSL